MSCGESIVFFEILLLSQVLSWKLNNYNLSSNYYVASMATYGNRVFLALPRSGCYNSIADPTLVETFWHNEPENSIRKKYFFRNVQDWRNCDHIQDAISLDVDSKRSRMWVLDKGNEYCRAKIFIYGFIDKKNYTAELPSCSFEKLSCITVDTEVKLNNVKAYVGFDDEPLLLVFSLKDFQWHQIILQSAAKSLLISTKYLALSRTTDVLYFTGDERRAMFSIKLSVLRNSFEVGKPANATYLGEKLGSSSALATDGKDGLYYYLTRDYAIVFWNKRYPSQAEYYSVIAQSYEMLPYVSQFYTGPQSGIWALVNIGDPKLCVKNNSITLKERLVKISKYKLYT